jgi:GGDEF domain-containing protein
MTISAGVALRSDQDSDRDSLLRRADEALYEAKAAGRNTVIIAGAEEFSASDSAG